MSNLNIKFDFLIMILNFRKPIFNWLKAKVYKWINRKAFFNLHFIYESLKSLVFEQGFYIKILC